jgi:hypothetical protein
MSPVRKFKYNDEFKVADLSCKYYYKADHRDKSHQKSQWTLTPAEELKCFIHSRNENWSEPYKSWGIWVNTNKLDELGKNYGEEELNVAVFVDSYQKDVWHGYPADFKRDKWDIPPMKVLTIWRDKKYTTKSKISNARQGKTCSL